MIWKKRIKWLKALTEASGVTGDEGEIKRMLVARLTGKAVVSYDKLGSVIFEKSGTAAGPRIMLAAHMDEIGFFVKHITKEGFVKFGQLGGWPDQVLLSQRVEILSKSGRHLGVIGSMPPHLMDADQRKKLVEKKDMYIDIGATDDQQVKGLGIRPGDPIVPVSEFKVMGNEKLLLAKAWDDRVGCAIMVDVIEELQNIDHPNTVFAVGTVQEEVGLRGARTAVNAVKPDLAIIVDVGINGDTPGVTPEKSAVGLGKGPAITVYDTSMVPHRRFKDFIFELAEKHNIPFQYSVVEAGGTDAGAIHLSDTGVPSIAISMPARYIHSHNGLIHTDDYDNTLKLITLLIQELTSERYRQIIEN